MIRLLEDKIKSPDKLKRIVSYLKKHGERIVFTNGCFDILHYGHVKYLQEAKRKGDCLIVAVNSDASVRKIKGSKRPIVRQKDRLRIVAALESVDYVASFNQTTPLEIIKILKPDVLIKGSDWDKNDIVGKDIVLKYGGRVHTIKLVKNRSTTAIIKKVAQAR
ncbi:MAG: D-glycero-beta-D-manno-heptose 1-phosphate adenylyltransferase [Candidatus Omnitrophica bacterium]|nr:D-glycero-beta-D-manno-heptose 1-phosphate adenylyltransferase [Candidatus Omnitrophota bacterium]MDD5591727.1 D-glycero-beta-D-manno-heptose 1-phosphate adenylyltransferase [Candidatus Omnitrophota bacterium]